MLKIYIQKESPIEVILTEVEGVRIGDIVKTLGTKTYSRDYRYVRLRKQTAYIRTPMSSDNSLLKGGKTWPLRFPINI